MCKQLNVVPIYNIIFMSGAHGVGVGWGRLGVCGSAVVPYCDVWVACLATLLSLAILLSLELEGSREGILYYDEIYIMIIEK